jgi:hypothetical protein
LAETQKIIETCMSLPEESVQIVRDMAQKANTSMAEIVRRAIWTDKFLRDAVDEGSLILIKDKDNSMRQLLLR